jgi:hypothetical protein
MAWRPVPLALKRTGGKDRRRYNERRRPRMCKLRAAPAYFPGSLRSEFEVHRLGGSPIFFLGQCVCDDYLEDIVAGGEFVA